MDKSQEQKPSKILNFYEKQYKLLLLIPLLLLLAAIIQISVQTATTGDFLNKGVSLKGGIISTIDQPTDTLALETAVKKALPAADVDVKTIAENGVPRGAVVTIDIDPADAKDLETFQETVIKTTGITENQFQENIQTITPQFSQSFFSAVFKALILAFIFMGVVVFIYFRTPAPSLAIILAAASDIIVTLAIVNILGIKLSSAGIAAFLMLIGYSVDTDILLTTKVLKHRQGSITDRVIKAMKTGLMMNLTTVVALVAALFFAISDDIRQIMIILIIGLLVDNINTWIQNVGILRYYLERKERKHHG